MALALGLLVASTTPSAKLSGTDVPAVVHRANVTWADADWPAEMGTPPKLLDKSQPNIHCPFTSQLVVVCYDREASPKEIAAVA